jgi:hypothetical protein
MVPDVVQTVSLFSRMQRYNFSQVVRRVWLNSHAYTRFIGSLSPSLFTVILTLANIWSATDENYRSRWLDVLLAEVTAPSGKGLMVCRNRDSFSRSGACADS